MSRLGNYATTLSDMLKGKVSLSDAIKAGQSTPGGVLGKSSLGSLAGKASGVGNTISKSKDSGIYHVPGRGESYTGQKFSNTSGGNSTPLDGGDNLRDIVGSSSYGSGASSAQDRAYREAISSGWDDADDFRSDVQKDNEKFGESIAKLSNARDAYLKANEKNYNKKLEAIAGNRKLITKNQKAQLGDLAEDVRNSIFNTNLSLGVLGASNSSASGASAKALAKSAGKDRKAILQGYGDQISEQNQEEGNALEYYNLQRDKAYDWEERQQRLAREEYETNKKVLSKLKDRLPDWKKDDIEDEDENNLAKFMGQVAEISARARAFRNTLAEWMVEMGATTEDLASATIDINPPSALDTPEFTEQLNIEAGDEEEDFYDPNVQDKKKEGNENDILSNPLIFDEV